MRSLFCFLLACLFLATCADRTGQVLNLPELQQSVDVFRDSAGVNHIYAQNEHDLFFAQGYCAARDRLFQFELWRRQATGTVAEILGPREVKRDIGARLFKFRGDLKKEFNHYHPHGEDIIKAFTDGINAYVAETEKDPKLLPIEFRLLNIVPGRWTPEVIISRHQGLLGNLNEEIHLARAVSVLGVDKVKELTVFEPGEPTLQFDPKIAKLNYLDSITALYEAFRTSVKFTPQDVVAFANKNEKEFEQVALEDEQQSRQLFQNYEHNIGSNNWIVSGAHSQSGFPLLANDPHRALAAPSLRYMVHLNAPGWNVVGGGEPTIPGISIGHNEAGAWGLTIFSIDGEDIYVYELNPKDKNQYKYNGQWEDFKIIHDTIKVKGGADVLVDHKFTRHGPVTFIDSNALVAYAIRCAWLEPGGAPYLASLRMDQAKTWEEFREACSYSHLPGENMIWADKNGNIGWQAVGIAPIRKNWSGLIPVPGDGRFEWDGYLPIKELPHVFNPDKGYWATANENLVPPGYAHRNAVGWGWSDSSRANRINEVLGSGTKHSLQEMMALQFDYLSHPARMLVPLLADLESTNDTAEAARQVLLKWNFILNKNSVEAAIYVAWEKKISATLLQKVVPPEGKKYVRYIPITLVKRWIATSSPVFEKAGLKSRNQFLLACLEEAVSDLSKKLGPDMSKWQYGQAANHHVLIKHPLSNAVDEATREKLQVGPAPRGGYSYTPGMTTNSDNQSAGASFRMVVDLEDWDKTMFTNTPGQSGDPESYFYKNLFELWAADKHFPVYFSRDKIEKNSYERLSLRPE